MAGGIWTGQNKIRPGAYIQFKSVEKPGTILGTRGVAMMPVSMNWGGQIIELYGTDFEGRGSIGKTSL